MEKKINFSLYYFACFREFVIFFPIFIDFFIIYVFIIFLFKMSGYIDSYNIHLSIISSYLWIEEFIEPIKMACTYRNAYQRMRRKQDGKKCETEACVMKKARRDIIVIAIKESKTIYWDDLVDTIDQKPLGIPYKVIMKKLFHKKSISQTM